MKELEKINKIAKEVFGEEYKIILHLASQYKANYIEFELIDTNTGDTICFLVLDTDDCSIFNVCTIDNISFANPIFLRQLADLIDKVRGK